MSGPLARVRFLLDHRWSPRHMSDYVDGELDDDDTVRIHRHLEECGKCREILRGLRATVVGLARIGRADAPGAERSVAASIAAYVRSEVAAERRDIDAGR